MESETDVIPPTNPEPAVAESPQPEKKKRGRPPKPKGTTIAGSALVPDLEKHREGVETRLAYWVGAMPDMPTGTAYVGGVAFSKVTEDVTADATTASGTRRTPVIGSIQILTKDDIDRVQKYLPLAVARINKPDEEIPDRRGRLVRIPHADEIKAREKHGRRQKRYTQEPGDEPLARFLFMKLCDDQENPRAGRDYPNPLEITGLFWPGA